MRRRAEPSSVGNIHRRPEGRLVNRERQLEVQVLPLAPQDPMPTDLRDDVEIARLAASQPDVALGLDPEPRPFVHTRRHMNRDFLVTCGNAPFTARHARTEAKSPRAVAGDTAHGEHHVPASAAGDARALATAAARLRGPAPTVSATVAADVEPRNGQPPLGPVHRLLERQIDLSEKVSPALRLAGREPRACVRRGDEVRKQLLERRRGPGATADR